MPPYFPQLVRGLPVIQMLTSESWKKAARMIWVGISSWVSTLINITVSATNCTTICFLPFVPLMPNLKVLWRGSAIEMNSNGDKEFPYFSPQQLLHHPPACPLMNTAVDFEKIIVPIRPIHLGGNPLNFSLKMKFFRLNLPKAFLKVKRALHGNFLSPLLASINNFSCRQIRVLFSFCQPKMHIDFLRSTP